MRPVADLKGKFEGLRVFMASSAESPDKMKLLMDQVFHRDYRMLEREGFFAGNFISVDDPEKELPQPEVIPGSWKFKEEATSYLHIANFLQVAPEMIIFIDDDGFNRGPAEKAGLRVFDPKDLTGLEAAVTELQANPIPYDPEAVAAKLEELTPKPLQQYREEPPAPIQPPKKEKGGGLFGGLFKRKPKDGSQPQ